MVGAWVLDRQGRPLRPAITWEDSRAQALIDEHVAADPAFLSRIFASSGSVMQQGLHPAGDGLACPPRAGRAGARRPMC